MLLFERGMAPRRHSTTGTFANMIQTEGERLQKRLRAIWMPSSLPIFLKTSCWLSTNLSSRYKMSSDLTGALRRHQKTRRADGRRSGNLRTGEATMNVRFGILISLVGVVLAEPARASTWLSLCV